MQVRLKVLQGKSAGRKIVIPGPTFVIGRGDECDLRPKSDAISRRHCELEIREDRLLVRDKGSKNGTYLNEVRVEGDVEVQSGQILRIGRLQFEVIVKQPAAKPASTSDTAALAETDISDWLDEPDTGRRSETEPDTRQYMLDETDQVKLKEAQEADTEDSADSAAAAGEAAKAEKASLKAKDKKESDKEKDKRKLKPGKLPTHKALDTSNSQEAAANMLKKFFNRP